MDDARTMDGDAAHRPWGIGGGWPSVLGPTDRVSFFAEQARHRRATWRLSAVCAVAVVLAGLPLCLVVTPLLFAVIVVLTRLAALVVPISPSVPEFYRSIARAIGSVVPYVEYLDGSGPPVSIMPPLLGLAAILVPGILAIVALWFALRTTFRRFGVGAVLLSLGAREPRVGDLEERQLVNVVEEMAIAAGLPAPRVMLLDGQVANAAAIGSSPEDAVVVVSRQLLDELDRDETQGILGHLIASIGNGDLGIALTMVTVFRTFGLVTTLLDAPVSSTARRTLWRLVRVSLTSRGSDQRVAEETAQLLSASAGEVELLDVDTVLGSGEERARAPGGLQGLLTKVRVYAFFPIWAAAGMAKTALMLLTFGLLGPMIALTWRTRRYLADATAVQLTRYPDGLARGLRGLAQRGGGIRGGGWAAHLFVIGGRDRGQEELHQTLHANEGKPFAERAAAAAVVVSAGEQARTGGDATRKQSELSQFGWVALHPSLEKRLHRLRALGTQVELAAPDRSTYSLGAILGMLAFSPLLLLVVVLLGIAIALSTGLVVVFMMIPMMLVYGLFELLF